MNVASFNVVPRSITKHLTVWTVEWHLQTVDSEFKFKGKVEAEASGVDHHIKNRKIEKNIMLKLLRTSNNHHCCGGPVGNIGLCCHIVFGVSGILSSHTLVSLRYHAQSGHKIVDIIGQEDNKDLYTAGCLANLSITAWHVAHDLTETIVERYLKQIR